IVFLSVSLLEITVLNSSPTLLDSAVTCEDRPLCSPAWLSALSSTDTLACASAKLLLEAFDGFVPVLLSISLSVLSSRTDISLWIARPLDLISALFILSPSASLFLLAYTSFGLGSVVDVRLFCRSGFSASAKLTVEAL